MNKVLLNLTLPHMLKELVKSRNASRRNEIASRLSPEKLFEMEELLKETRDDGARRMEELQICWR